MSNKASKIFERMKQTKSGWHPHDFDTLYTGFGFRKIVATNHDVFIHPDFPQLRDTIPRHGELGKAYANAAVKNIETLIELRKRRGESHE